MVSNLDSWQWDDHLQRQVLTPRIFAFRGLFNLQIILAGIGNWQPYPSPQFPWTYAGVLAVAALIADVATMLDDHPDSSSGSFEWYWLFGPTGWYVILTYLERSVTNFAYLGADDPDTFNTIGGSFTFGWIVWFVVLGLIYNRLWSNREGLIRLVMFIPWSIRYRRMKRRGETY